MNKHSRARQFIPFAALKGYINLIKEQEKIKLKKREVKKLSDDELAHKIKQIKELKICEIIYITDGKIVKTSGIISKINFNEKWLICIKNKINFENIIDVNAPYIKEFDE